MCTSPKNGAPSFSEKTRSQEDIHNAVDGNRWYVVGAESSFGFLKDCGIKKRVEYLFAHGNLQ